MNKQIIADLKKNGQISALSVAIEDKIFEITNRTFEGYRDYLMFTGLHKKLEQVRFACDAIDELLAEIKKLDGKST